MGFDITYHPISENELKKYIFDPFNNRELIVERVRSLPFDKNNQDSLIECYSMCFEKIDKQQHINCIYFTNLAAVVSTYLHPYWYSRNECISFFIEAGLIENIFQPFLNYVENKSLHERLQHNQLTIDENYMTSGFASAEIASTLYEYLLEEFTRLIEYLKLNKDNDSDELLYNLEGLINGKEGEEIMWAIKNLTNYCRSNNLGFIESSDSVVPIFSDFGYCNQDNFQAKWS